MKLALFLIPFSTAFFFSDYDVPRTDDLLQEWGSSQKSQLLVQETYRFMTWNIYKGGMSGLYEDYSHFVETMDFVATQEFLLNSEQEQLIQNTPSYHWVLAKSFQDSGEWTGVATVSKWQAKQSIPVKSPGAEPFAGTPKMSLISLYPIEDGRELMVVNVHGLNFNLSHGDFKDQVDDLINRVKNHVGPMIMAGDFNTWADTRRTYLIKKTESIGLERADLENEMGIMNATLDHIFYREISVTSAAVLSDIQTSDHLPMTIEFKF
ncbi:MAG: endonuclease/exonuclease/phosphatase family protein [Bdellovibrionaceae bacterium]|nr:endonuclease/exonuclease/phosphatase family protein [Pseudobdellovibrionaceae bacterium]